VNRARRSPDRTTGQLDRFLRVVGVFCVLSAAVLAPARVASAQEPKAPETISPERLQAAIDQLGNLDYAARTNASRTVRRTAPSQAVPALLRAVAEHADGYVRYRALVLLTGFNDPRTKDAMRESLSSPNDRLRAVAYSFLEHNPDSSMIPALIQALGREQAEFVRPALIRALAAAGTDPRVQAPLTREALRGEDFFRSAVIEALGDYKAQYAFGTLVGIAKLDGPLLDDTALALGKIGDQRALETLAGLQRTAPRTVQPYVAAGICLLGVNCESHEGFLIRTLKFSDDNIGYQELLRAAAAGLAALGIAGHDTSVTDLLDIGIPARESTRAPAALGVATVALRRPPVILKLLQGYPRRAEAVSLLADGFDMLEEDLEKERFFALVRRTYWDSPEGSPTRDLMQTLIGKLDF
jgi:HEAT repeat protein